jgi:hypothetical protein
MLTGCSSKTDKPVETEDVSTTIEPTKTEDDIFNYCEKNVTEVNVNDLSDRQLEEFKEDGILLAKTVILKD